MIHIFHWRIHTYDNCSFLENDFFGMEVSYAGKKDHGSYFLYPIIDERSKSIYYFCRDTAEQKHIFESIIKISWIGPKTAFHISNTNQKELITAVDSMNIGFFQTIPWIGPKTAKRLVVELKTVVKDEDLLKIQWDEKVIKEIIKYCKWLGYDGDLIKEKLWTYVGEINKKSTSQVIQWLISAI